MRHEKVADQSGARIAGWIQVIVLQAGCERATCVGRLRQGGRGRGGEMMLDAERRGGLKCGMPSLACGVGLVVAVGVCRLSCCSEWKMRSRVRVLCRYYRSASMAVGV